MTRRGWALLLTMGLIWGVPYFFIKVAVDEVTPATVVLARCVVGFLVLLPFAVRGGGPAVLRGHWPAVAAFALLEIVGPWFLIANAERHVHSATAGLLIAAVPVVAVVGGRFLGDRRPVAPVRWLGLAVGLAGVALLTGPLAAEGRTWAVVQLLLAAVGYALAPLIVERRLRHVPSVPLTAACLGLTSLVYLPVVLLEGELHVPSARAVGALAVLSVVCTALAFVLFFTLIAEVGGPRSTLVAYLNPLVAVLLGALVLDEPLTWAVAAATALILGGSALAARRGTVDVAELEETGGLRPRPRRG